MKQNSQREWTVVSQPTTQRPPLLRSLPWWLIKRPSPLSDPSPTPLKGPLPLYFPSMSSSISVLLGLLLQHLAEAGTSGYSLNLCGINEYTANDSPVYAFLELLPKSNLWMCAYKTKSQVVWDLFVLTLTKSNSMQFQDTKYLQAFSFFSPHFKDNRKGNFSQSHVQLSITSAYQVMYSHYLLLSCKQAKSLQYFNFSTFCWGFFL